MLKQKNSSGENWGPIPVALSEVFPSKTFLRPETPSDLSEISGISNFQFSDSQLDDYESLEEDRFELQNEVLAKDTKLNELERKLEVTQCQLLKMCHENKSMTQKLKESQGASFQKDLKAKLASQVENATKLSSNIEKLSSHLKNLRGELDGLKNEKKTSMNLQERYDKISKICPSPSEDSRKVKLLESQYTNLQTEYCQREKQYKEMMERMKGLLDKCDDDKERAINEALKKRADEMIEEINDSKVFIRELQEQVENYRDKFMKGK